MSQVRFSGPSPVTVMVRSRGLMSAAEAGGAEGGQPAGGQCGGQQDGRGASHWGLLVVEVGVQARAGSVRGPME